MTTFNKYLDNPTVRITLFVGGIDEKVGWVKIGVSGMRVRFQNHSGLRCNTEKSLQFGNQEYKLVVSFRFCTFRPFCGKIVCSSPLLCSAPCVIVAFCILPRRAVLALRVFLQRAVVALCVSPRSAVSTFCVLAWWGFSFVLVFACCLLVCSARCLC